MIKNPKPKSTKLLKSKYENLTKIYFDFYYKNITGRALKKVTKGKCTFFLFKELANDKKATAFMATEKYRLFIKYNKMNVFVRFNKELYVTEKIAFDVMRYGERTGTVRKALERLPVIKKLIIKHSIFDYEKYEN